MVRSCGDFLLNNQPDNTMEGNEIAALSNEIEIIGKCLFFWVVHFCELLVELFSRMYSRCLSRMYTMYTY